MEWVCPCSSFSLYSCWFSLLLKNQRFQNEFLSVRTPRCFMEKQISIFHIIIFSVNDEGKSSNLMSGVSSVNKVVILGSLIYWPSMCFYSFLSQDVPTAADFVKVSGLRFSSSDLLRMERIILDKLNWNLNATTPLYFLQVVSICNEYHTWNLPSFFLSCFFISIPPFSFS